jgi:hypothetical protein
MLFSNLLCLVGVAVEMVSAGPIRDFLDREIAFFLFFICALFLNIWSSKRI